MSDWALAGPTLLPDGDILPATVYVTGAVIARVRRGIDPGAERLAGGTIVPGFIDLQINGAYGHDFTADGRTVADVALRLPRTGVTAFLPTIITSPWEAYPGAFGRSGRRSPKRRAPRRRAFLGVHLEGPYLNPLRRGAHAPAHLRPINVAEIVAWAEPDLVRLVTLAPELPAAPDAVRALRERGIVVSAGHSDATYDQAKAAFAAGVGWGTHLFNAMPPWGHRAPGLAGALLASDVPCGMIVDGIHVHRAAVKVVVAAKGAGQVTLVTDAMEAMGMPPGAYRLAGREVIVDHSSARLAEDGTLAGSILTMDAAVRNAMAFSGCSLAEAVAMATSTPARVLGLAQRGRIVAGCHADLVVLDGDLQVARTWVRGRLAYERGAAA